MKKSEYKPEYRKYLGDSIYADFNDHGQIVLTTENGITVNNKIYLELEVMDNLLNYLTWLKEEVI